MSIAYLLAFAVIYINIFFLRGYRCSSYIGRIGGAQRMSLDPSCYRNGEPGSVIHEFMHAFGFHHEQSRTDRDDYVIINYPNIQPGMCGIDYWGT